MSNVQKVSIALTLELADLVKEAVESGDYASSSEVMRDALRGWAQTRAERVAKLAELRAAIQQGLDSGIAPHRRTADEIIAEGRRRLAAKG
jgi:antitoxin ParD1/3/4